MTTSEKSLIREVNGNVVLKSGRFQLRFFQQYGGTPLEWWKYGSPGPLTNAFPGSAASINFEVGQDPTQASANGLLQNPIKTLQGGSVGYDYGYYGRESLFDATGIYEVVNYMPDFWLSHEAIDDAIAPNYTSEHGWRTKYTPGGLYQRLISNDLPVIFQASPQCTSGIFLVGNEKLAASVPWNNRLREYQKLSFKCKLSLKYAANTAIGGFIFRKNIPYTNGVNKDAAYFANGLELNFNKRGGWELRKRAPGIDRVLDSGRLLKDQLKLLLSEYGLQIEIRSTPVSSEIELWVDKKKLKVITNASDPSFGKHFGLFASTNTGHIMFGDRDPRDMSVKATAMYRAVDGENIISTHTIETENHQALDFYAANMPGVFLNQGIFGTDRSCKAITWADEIVELGETTMNYLKDYKSFWCGNMAGDLGIQATPLAYKVQQQTSEGAHLLQQKHAFNDEFVLMLNPFSPNVITQANYITMETLWRADLKV